MAVAIAEPFGYVWCIGNANMRNTEMTRYAITVEATYWGAWTADTPEAAKQAAVDDLGADNTDGLVAYPVTEAEEAECDAWWYAGGKGIDCPACLDRGV